MHEFQRLGYLLEFGLIFDRAFKNASGSNLRQENSCLQKQFQFG